MPSAGEFFARADQLGFSSLDEAIGPGGLVVVAPHPDDESLGCGGLIAMARDAGRQIRIVVLTDGTRSHPTSKAYPRERLRALRETECIAACAALGLAAEHVFFLRLPDGSCPVEGSNAEDATARIVALCEDLEASALAVTWRFDPHGDHQAAFRLAWNAFGRLQPRPRLIEYSIWGHTLPADTVLESRQGFRLDVSPVLARKSAAIQAHRSQVTPLIDDDPNGYYLPRDMVARFERPFEVFFN